MQYDMRLNFKRGDLLAFALVLLMAAAVFLCFLPLNRDEAGGTVEIYQDGELVKSCLLTQNAEVEIAGEYTNTVSISDGRAAITQSNCPGEDCMHSGWISAAGRSIVCLPNRVEVRITGATDDVDFAVR